MGNNLGELNNVLFKQLERLSNKDLKGEALNDEIKKSQAVEKIAKSIINNSSLALQAMKFYDDRMDADLKLPKMLEG